MISSEATNDRFGYDPSTLVDGSSKSVVFICDFCHSEFVSSKKTQYRNNRISTCQSCRSLGASYSPDQGDPHIKWLQTPKFSKTKITLNCEFCLSDFDTSHGCHVKGTVSCKSCGGVASSYSRRKLSSPKNEFYLEWLKSVSDINFSALNEERTFSEFGYNSKDLSTFSKKKVWAKCEVCSVDIVLNYSKYSSRKGNVICSSQSCVWQKTKATLKREHGVECTLDIASVREQLTNPKTEKIVESVLSERYSVEFSRNYSIGPYSFDFYIPSCSLLVECQGDYFHKFKEFGYSGTPKDRAKASYVENQTPLKLVWIYEHELNIGRINKILDYHIYNVTEPEITFPLNDVTISVISSKEAHNFLAQFHYLGNLGTVSVSYGAFYNGQLIAVCTFGGVTRNQTIKKVNDFLGKKFGPKDIRELRRFCIRPNVAVKNLSSFLLSKFVKEVKGTTSPKLIVSFSDPTVDDSGGIYKASSWQHLYDTSKSYHYIDLSNNKYVHKKTVWDSARSAHMTEIEFSLKLGLVRVEEMPKKLWVKLL